MRARGELTGMLILLAMLLAACGVFVASVWCGDDACAPYMQKVDDVGVTCHPYGGHARRLEVLHEPSGIYILCECPAGAK